MTDDTSSPLSTGYNTRSGSEEIVTDAGDLQAGTSLHGSQELLANARTRMRTASELLLDRRLHIPELEEAERFEAQQGRTLRLLRAGYQCVAAHSELLCYFIIIWFPLLFMSLIRSVVGVVNQPIDVTVTLKLGGYEPLFTMSAQQPSIVPFTPQAYEELSQQFDPYPLAMQFISQYSPEDIVTAQIEGSSGALWRISPPSRAQMKQELYNGTADITLRFTWNFQRDLAKGGTVEYTNEKHTLELAPNSTARRQLAQLLEGRPDQSVVIPHLFPKYIRAPNGPEANPVKQLQPDEEEDYLGVRIQLRREQVGTGASGEQAGTKASDFLEWWVIELQDCKADCNLLPMVIFSDKVSPPSLGFLAGYGIVGLYVSIVLVVGKFVRGFFSEISHSIMFEELPCVDRILKLCQDIFLVRETRELELEEELYAKLIFLYRSPETMIKWTRERE